MRRIRCCCLRGKFFGRDVFEEGTRRQGAGSFDADHSGQKSAGSDMERLEARANEDGSGETGRRVLLRGIEIKSFCEKGYSGIRFAEEAEILGALPGPE